MSNKKFRDIQRSIHLVAATILLVYLLMWQLPTIRRIMNARKQPDATRP